jgi:hypothetical protein
MGRRAWQCAAGALGVSATRSRAIARTAAIPAPSRGWNTRDPLATMEPGYAPTMDNVVVEGGAPRVRRGWRSWSTGLPARVDGLLPYVAAGASEAMFAASSTGIYAITSTGAVGSAAVTGLTSARWDGINFSAPGGNFLFAWNGADTERTYDGSTWATWTATGITGRTVWANAFKSRMFVGTSGYLGFWYGGAGAIAGAFTAFPLQGIAKGGGSLIAMATLSGENGNGQDDLAVFLTSNGEAIVYAGTDPSSASTWALVGTWQLPRPLGSPHRCTLDWGGDVLYLCDQGVVPLSAFRGGADTAQVMEQAALTRMIAPTWRSIVNDRRTLSGWGMCALTRLGLVVINVPWSSTAAQQIVISEGGAVSRWAGINAAVWAEGLGGRVFVGDASATGRVFLYGEDTDDNGAGIRSECITAFSALRSFGKVKRALQVQPVLRDVSGFTLSIDALRDWAVPTSQVDSLGSTQSAPALPPYVGGGSIGLFDTAIFDVSLFGGGEGETITPVRGLTGVGQAFAMRLQMVSGNSRPAWLGSNMTYEMGDVLR